MGTAKKSVTKLKPNQEEQEEFFLFEEKVGERRGQLKREREKKLRRCREDNPKEANFQPRREIFYRWGKYTETQRIKRCS